MRFKLLIENIKHHFIISFLLLISLSLLFSMFLIRLEYVDFIVKYNQEEYLYENNYFDIVIQSTTGVSTYGSKEFRSEYEKCSSFCQVAVLGDCNGKSLIINVYEGKTDINDEKYDYKNVFHFDANLQSNQTIITKELSENLDVSIGDTITIHVGEKTYPYKVIKIVDEDGFFSKNTMLTTGTTISKEFLYLPTMSNLIYIKLNNLDNLDDVYQKLDKSYDAYSVINVRDTKYFKSIISTDANIYISMTIIILFGLFLLIRKIYQKKLKKQQELINNFQYAYYQKYNYLARSVLFILSYILSIVIGQIFFSITSNFYNNPFDYKITLSSCFALLIFAMVVYCLLLIKVKIKKPKKYEVYILGFLGILIGIEILSLLIKNKQLFAITSVIITISFIALLIYLICKSFKKIKSFLKRIYLYDLGKKSPIEKLIIGMYIIIACFFSILISSLTYYNNGINKLDSMIKIKTLVISEDKKLSEDKTVNYEKVGVYDFIRINDGKKDYDIDTVLGFDVSQIEKYTDIILTDKEKEQFASTDSIILPLYFRNKLGCQVGDAIEVKCPGDIGTKEYRIVKFMDGIYWKIAIINRDDKMMNGYVISDDLSGLKNNLNKTKYNVINVEKQILSIQSFYKTNIKQVSLMLIFIMLIFLVFMFYLAYIDFEIKKESIEKLMILGLSNDKLLGLNIFKMSIHMIITAILSILLSSVVTYFFDDIASIFKTTFYIKFSMKYVLASALLMLICLGLGMLYTMYIMLKNKKTE